MELSKLLRGLIIFQFLWLVAIVIVTPDDPAYDGTLDLTLIASLIYTVLFLVSLVLLFIFKPLGRTLFFASAIFGMLLSLGLPEPSIPNGNLFDALNWFGGILDGAMLAILYLTEIKERFQKS
jgi:O-antigen ligase